MADQSLQALVKLPLTGLRYALSDKLLRIHNPRRHRPIEEAQVGQLISVLELEEVQIGQVLSVRGRTEAIIDSMNQGFHVADGIWELIESLQLIQADPNSSEPLKFYLETVIRDWQALIFPAAELKKMLDELRDGENGKAILEELENAQAAIQKGRAPKEIDLGSPEKQLLWAAHLLFLLFNPYLMQGWSKKDHGNFKFLHCTPWKQILKSHHVRYLRALFGSHIYNLLRNQDVLVGWGSPGSWFSFNPNPAPGRINCDLLYSLIVGFDHARACAIHEIGHAVQTVGAPDYITELADRAENAEIEDEDATQQEAQLKHYFLNACEDNCVNRYTAEIGKVFGQDYGYSLNYFYTAIGDVGRRYTKKQVVYADDSPKNRFKNLTFIISRVFLAHNGLFPNEPEAWQALMAKPEWITARDRRDGETQLDNAAAWQQLMEMTEEVEHYYPELRELAGGPEHYNALAETYAEKRFELIEEMWKLFAEDIVRELLDEDNSDVDDAMDQFQQRMNDQPEQKKKEQDNQEEEEDEGSENEKEKNEAPPTQSDQNAEDEVNEDLDGDDAEYRDEEEGEEGEEEQDAPGEGEDADGGEEQEEDDQPGDAPPDSGGEGQQEQPTDQEQQEVPPPEDGQTEEQERMQEQQGEPEAAGDDEQSPEEQLEKLMEQLQEMMAEYVEKDDPDQEVIEDDENPEAEMLREIEDVSQPEEDSDPDDAGEDGDAGDPHGGDDSNEVLEREYLPDEPLASVEELMEALKEAEKEAEKEEKERRKPEQFEEEKTEPRKMEIPPALSLDELAHGSWEDFAQRVAMHGPVIGMMAEALKKLKMAQLKLIHKISRRHSLIPQGGELRRFDQAQLNRLIQRIAKREKFDKDDLNMFRKDDRIAAATRPTRVIVIDGSRSMTFGDHPFPMDKAIQEAVIDYMASRIAGYDTFISMFGPKNPLMIAEPGDSLVEIGKTIEKVHGGLNTMTYLSPALLQCIERVAYRKKFEEPYVGFTNFVIYSDGDIDDLAPSRMVIEQIMQHAPKSTFDFVLITHKSATPMDVLIRTLDVTNPVHEIGVVRSDARRRFPMALTATYKLTNRLRAARSGFADPSWQRSAQFKRLLKHLTR